jgi:hypothetical protein
MSDVAQPKRPRYLVAALALALAFGVECWTFGYARLSFYRYGPTQDATLGTPIAQEDSRARVEAAYTRFLDAADDAKRRSVPLAAANFVLGAALLALAARGLSRRPSARGALVQVVVVQAAVAVGGYLATKAMRDAEMAWIFEISLAKQPVTPETAEALPLVRSIQHVLVPAWLVVRTLASGLIVLALTRPRSRAFFEAAADPLSER